MHTLTQCGSVTKTPHGGLTRCGPGAAFPTRIADATPEHQARFQLRGTALQPYLPAEFGLAPSGGRSTQTLLVEVDAMQDSSTLFTTRTRVAYLPGTIGLVRTFLSEHCLPPMTCAGDQTCGERGCEPIGPPAALSPYSPLSANATCTPGEPCGGGATCLDGQCPFTHALQIAVGQSHACALTSDGTLRCWGSNSSGMLGARSSSSATPIEVRRGLPPGALIAAGRAQTCLWDGAFAQCWGRNDDGQLADGTFVSRGTPDGIVLAR